MIEPQLPRQLPAPPVEIVAPQPQMLPHGPAYYSADFQQSDEPVVPFSHYLWVIRRHRWKIFCFVLVCIAGTAIVSARLTPIYESSASLDVDRQIPTSVIGQDAARPVADDTDQFMATQVRLIQSDSVLRPVVQKYRLIDYDKALQQAKAKQRGNPMDASVVLRDLKVTRPTGTYILLISYRSPDPQLAANVANAVATSYVEHTYNIRFRASASLSSFMEKQLEELKAKREKSSAALASFERELNVINPEEKTSILTARLIQLNTEYTNAQAERVRKQATENSVQTGSLEAELVSTQGESLRKLMDQLDEAQSRFVHAKAQYGVNHPEYKKAELQLNEVQRQLDKARQTVSKRVNVEYQEALNREHMLQGALADTKKEFDSLNARSFEYRALKQEADADKTLYEELVRKIREAGINASFQDSSIRLADPARPEFRAVSPNIPLNVALAFIFSTLLAFGAAIGSDMLDNTIRDPEGVARILKTETIGSLPMVKPWHGTPFVSLPGGGSEKALASRNGSGRNVAMFEEAMRTVRDSILLSDVDRRHRTLLLTSAVPAEGKTTTAIHLALAHASQKRRTLLIDADLRRPGVRSRFNLSSDIKGLSNVIDEGIDWKTVLAKNIGGVDLDILTAGPASRRAADRIGIALEPILREASLMYDQVIVDSPPLVGFAEPLQIATLVDVVVLLTLAGKTNRRAVASALNALKRLRVNLLGLILNEVHGEISDGYYYYGYGYSNKYYNYYHSPE